MRIIVILTLTASLGLVGCEKPREVDRVSIAQREVACDVRRDAVVRHIVSALEIQYLGKSNFVGTKNMTDEEYKVAMERDIIPAYLEDKADKRNTEIALELWKSKHLFEKMSAKQVPYASINGTPPDNSEQKAAIWKIGKEICIAK